MGIVSSPTLKSKSTAPSQQDRDNRLWRDAVDGSELFERYLLGRPCGWLPPRLIWSLASIPVRRRRRWQMAFELIVPEASAPAFGMRQATCVTTWRTINPFRRVAMMAAVQQFNQDPLGWLKKFSNSATVAGRTVPSTKDWREVAAIVMHIDPEREPNWARRAWGPCCIAPKAVRAGDKATNEDCGKARVSRPFFAERQIELVFVT